MNNTDGKTGVLGLIGKPVEHTLSPIIQNMLAEEYDRNVIYVPFLVERDLPTAIRGAYELNIMGLNVTVPYKRDVIPLVCEIDSLAEKIGAVNTLVRTEKGYKGYNTDMLGLLRDLNVHQVGINGEHVILVGAGGVARAVAVMCAENGAASIRIMNRTVERATAVADEVRNFGYTCELTACGLNDVDVIPDRKHLVFQCTNIGMYPNCGEVAIEDPNFYEKIHTGYDLIYRPAETGFMQLVSAHGGRAINGLGMLLYQGIIAFELWNDLQIADESAAKIAAVIGVE